MDRSDLPKLISRPDIRVREIGYFGPQIPANDRVEYGAGGRGYALAAVRRKD